MFSVLKAASSDPSVCVSVSQALMHCHLSRFHAPEEMCLCTLAPVDGSGSESGTTGVSASCSAEEPGSLRLTPAVLLS